MPDQPRVEVSRPRAHQVRLRDNRPRSVVVTLAPWVRIDLRPEERDQGAQLRWLDAAIAELQKARRLMEGAYVHRGEDARSSTAAPTDDGLT